MNNPNSSVFNRRNMLKFSIAGAGAATLGACAESSESLAKKTSPAAPIMSDQELQDRKYELKQRMRFRMDSGDMIWTFKGVIYAQKGAKIIPMFNFVHCAFGRIQPRQQGGFDMLSYELGFRLDLKTGERLTQFTNPFSGDVGEIPFAPVGPFEIEYTPEIELKLPDNIGGSKIVFRDSPDVFRQANNMIYLDQMNEATVATEGKPDRVINEMTTIYGSAEQLVDKSSNFVATQAFNSDISDYPRWMNMSSDYGSQTLRTQSLKVESAAGIPKQWMNIIKDIDPEIYKNPMSVLDRSEAKYLG